MDMILLQNLLPPTTLGIFVVAIIVVLLLFALFVNHKSSVNGKNKPLSSTETTVDDYVAAHGDPETILVLDSIRSNELNYVILIYKDEVIVEGKPIKHDSITDVSFFNAQNPYMDKEYHLVITTHDTDNLTIEVPMGNDLENAENIVNQLKGCLAST